MRSFLTSPLARLLAWPVALLLVTLYVMVLLPGGVGNPGRGTPAAILLDAAVHGLAASLTAVGIIIVHRSINVINFAQTALGSVGALILFKYVLFTDVPFFLMLPLAVVVGAIVGVAFDLAFGRRFADSPRLVLTVFTIAVAFGLSVGETGEGGRSGLSSGLQYLPGLPRPSQLSAVQLQMGIDARPELPLPGLEFTVGSLGIPFGFPHLLAIELVVIALLALAAFYRYSRFGIALRALADNPERAALLGISTGTLTSIMWGISAALSTVSATAIGALERPSEIGSFSPTTLFTALAAAIIARMRSIPVAVAVAVVIEVVTSATLWSFQDSRGYLDLGLLLLVVAALAVQRRERGRSESGAAVSWQATDEPRAVPRELAGISSVRALRWVTLGLVVVAVVVYPFFVDVRTLNLTGLAALAGIVGLSLVVLTGWAGQVSLGQYGFVCAGAVIAQVLAGRVGIPGGFWLVVPLTTVAVAGFAALVGMPALRLKGMYLAVVTLGFGIAVPAVLLSRTNAPRILPESIERPQLFVIDFDDERNMYYLCVAALLLAGIVVRNLRSTRVGRLLIAARDNEANLQSKGVALLRTKLLAFVVSGALAGFAGAIYAYQQRAIGQEAFGPTASMSVFLFAVLGGIASPAGAVLGAVFGRFTTQILADNVVLASMQGVLLIAILYAAPGGFASMLTSVRDTYLRIVAQRRRIIVPSLFADLDPQALRNRLVPLAEPGPDRGLNALPPEERFGLPSHHLTTARGGTAVLDAAVPPETDSDPVPLVPAQGVPS